MAALKLPTIPRASSGANSIADWRVLILRASSRRSVRSAAFSPMLRALASRSGWRLTSYQ